MSSAPRDIFIVVILFRIWLILPPPLEFTGQSYQSQVNRDFTNQLSLTDTFMMNTVVVVILHALRLQLVVFYSFWNQIVSLYRQRLCKLVRQLCYIQENNTHILNWCTLVVVKLNINLLHCMSISLQLFINCLAKYIHMAFNLHQKSIDSVD